MNLYICHTNNDEPHAVSLSIEEACTVFAKYVIKAVHFDSAFVELSDKLPYELLSMVRTASDRIFIRVPPYINEKMVYLLGEVYPDRLGTFLGTYKNGGDVYELLPEVW